MMDTSEIYIKQCEKAEEIQKDMSYPYRISDPRYPYYIGNNVFIDVDIGSATWHTVWLPRQDQLQEMIGSFMDCLKLQTEFFDEKRFSPYWDTFISMEQLWLAFVMKKKFGKVWNGEDWEKVEGE